MALTKNVVIDTVQDKVGFSRNVSSKIIETLLEIIKETLEQGEDIMISGFGKFCVVEKQERKGRNPATAEMMMLPPRKVVTFKCSGSLKNRLNGE